VNVAFPFKLGETRTEKQNKNKILRTQRMIQGAGGRQLLEITKHRKMAVRDCQMTLYSWWKINCALIGRRYVNSFQRCGNQDYLSVGCSTDSHLWANSFTAVQRFLASPGAAETIQPPCSPDLGPAEYLSLIPEVKIDLKGSRFQESEKMKNSTTQRNGRFQGFYFWGRKTRAAVTERF